MPTLKIKNLHIKHKFKFNYCLCARKTSPKY